MDWKTSFLIIAHRGASAYEPENTIAAFKRAIEMGSDAIELDVRKSRDGIPVVVHDEDLKRIANISRKVCELTLEELRGIRVFGREPIPTLDEVLSELGNRTVLFIEIKDEGIEGGVVESIRRFQAYDRVLIISFNYRALTKVKELCNKIDVGLLAYRHPLPIDEALRLRAFAILPRYHLVSPRSVKEIHSKDLKVYAWTVNDASLALRLIGYGIDGIATDDPAIRNHIRKQQKLRG